MTDSFPGSLTAVSYTAVATGGASGFTASGNGNIDDLAVIFAGRRLRHYLYRNATIVSSATGTFIQHRHVGSERAQRSPPAPTDARIICGLPRPTW